LRLRTAIELKVATFDVIHDEIAGLDAVELTVGAAE
jgi:hypothetical protein